jgi:hypothetical protein
MLQTGPNRAKKTVEIYHISLLLNLTLREANELIDCLHILLNKEEGEQVNLCEFCTYYGFDIDEILMPVSHALTGY